MLRYLVAHPGRLVTKAEVRQHVWGARMSPRRAAGVVCRRFGRRWAMRRRRHGISQRWDGRAIGGWWAGDLEGRPPLAAGPLVGRQGDVAALEAWYQQAAHGTPPARLRQWGSGGGEDDRGRDVPDPPGRRAREGGRRGASVSSTLGRGNRTCPSWKRWGAWATGRAVLAVLRRYAPLWLAQLPGLVSEAELERLQGRLHGTTPARMLRELAEALEVLTADRVLVLVLEDVQWSDRATVEALAYLAQRREPARLLVLGTYRPVEVLLQGHPLRGMVQELCGRGQASRAAAGVPDRRGGGGVCGRAAGRAGGRPAHGVGRGAHGRQCVVHGEHRGASGAAGVGGAAGGAVDAAGGGRGAGASLPEGLRELLLRRIEALPPAAQRVLEAASVVGEAFAVAAVAAGVQGPMEDVEAVCDGLAAQRHFLDDTGWTVWPDGTRSGAIAFSMRSTARCCTSAWAPCGASSSIGALGPGWRRAMAPGRARSRPARRPLRARGRGPRAVHYWQQAGEMRPGAMPITKRSPPSPKGWRCWRPAGQPRARPARTRAAAHPGGAADGGEGHGGPGSG